MSVRSGEPAEIAGGDYARDLLALYEAFQGKEGEWLELG